MKHQTVPLSRCNAAACSFALLDDRMLGVILTALSLLAVGRAAPFTNVSYLGVQIAHALSLFS